MRKLLSTVANTYAGPFDTRVLELVCCVLLRVLCLNVLRPTTSIFLKWTLAVTVLTQHPLWWEDGSAFYNCCCWSSPAQSSSGPSPAGLMTTFYCLRFETPPTWMARCPYLYPPGTGWPSYTPRHWGPFRRLLRLAATYWIFYKKRTA
jgi:hypothetical protein